ncbi:MAG: TonB-dependent receptor [Ignavibacteriales bacterium]|nr:TonB-dependent receptor [Ignavibacteriales bacterium]
MQKIFFLLVFTIQLSAQNFTVSGIVKDSLNGTPLSLANVFISELNSGTTCNSNGKFEISFSKKGEYQFTFSFIGYEKVTRLINIPHDKFIEVSLLPSEIWLGETTVISSLPKFRETPVAFSVLTSKDINLRLGSKEAIHILETTPSSYISQQGGGIGEQRLSIRGFDQTNIAVMINGIPINNPENGEIYWSNWAGISDIIEYIHVQRGLSAIPYSISAIGGSVNFITTGSSALNPGAKFKTEFGSDNLKKSAVSFTSQLTEKIGLTGLVSKRTMDGFADKVYSDELAYFLALGMLFDDVSIQVQLFGSPQKHGQRLTPQTINDWSNYGKEYNADWGNLNGKPLNLRDNEFHNPTLSINQNWQITKDLVWNNIISLSRGIGGGTVPPWYPELSRTETGQIDFDKEWQLNSNNIDSIYSPNLNKSVIALRKGIHKNYRANLISVLGYNFNNLKFTIGFDGKYYEAQNYNQLSNLLGGDYTTWSNDVNDNPNKMLYVGDKVDFNADSFTRSFGSFFQVEYLKDPFSAYLNLALSKTQYNQINYFNFLKTDPNRETGWKSFTGASFKAGINYNINGYNNVFFNIGNFSRAPLSMNVYDYENNVYGNSRNEKIFSFEIGYGLKTEITKLSLNYFSTDWKDKAFSQAFTSNETQAIYYYSLFGASARHSGIEFDGILKVTQNLQLNTMFSYLNNKWTSDIDAAVRPESNPNDEINFHTFSNNLYVGDFPMTTASIGFYYENEISNKVKVYFNPIYNFYGRYYSKFVPESRTNSNDANIQPWRLPNFYYVDLHLGFEILLDHQVIKNLNISFNLFNILNQEFISDAIDGETHNAQSALVWFGRERWWSTNIVLEF